ncbi:hypothetical protein CsSME_00033603 [Camellia sinensis var. sinensis]
MMNVENDDVESETDLGLALAYSNPCIPTRLSNSGAGVNAAPRVDLAFVASDLLSELVWSPHIGLSLKCTDCRFAEKKQLVLWDVEPSNMVLSPPQDITSRETTDEKPKDELNLITSQMALHVKSEVDEGSSLGTSPRSIADIKPVLGSSLVYHAGTSDKMEEMSTAGGASVAHTNIAEIKENNAGRENQKTTDFLPLRTNEREHNEVMMANPSDRLGDIASGSLTLGLEVALTSEVHSMKQCKGLNSPVQNMTSPSGRHKALAIVIEEDSKNKMKMDGSTSVLPLEKLEFSAENDLQLWIGEDDKSVPSEASPTKSRTRLYRRKGKAKALSAGDVNERMPKNDEDDSHESVESCNSAGLFSIGKKRWSFAQQSIVESKRVKNQIQESPVSTSFVGHDSSFMNWISNMVKGLNKTNQDESPSLALTLAHPTHDQKIVTFSRNQDPGSRNMGFQTMFQSLYCSNSMEQKTKKSDGNSLMGGSKELVLANQMSGVNVSPIACHGVNDNFRKHFSLSDEKFNQSTSENRAGPSVEPMTSPANIAAAPEMRKTSSCSYQNKTSDDLACINVKDGKNSSSSSLGKRKSDSAENNDSNPPPKAKVINNVGYRCDPLGSLWITRFCAKTPVPTLNLDHCNQNTSGALACSSDYTKLFSHTLNHVDFPVDQKSSEAKENSTEEHVNVTGKKLQSCAPSSEDSFGFNTIRGHNDQKSIYKLNPILPSPKQKNSEAMASVFARRLDALKHIIPVDVKDNTTHTMTTCFYCGKSGHDLRVCSEITETERENLIGNISSSDGADDSPCLCIKCFKLDHWAISCPMASMTKQHQSECDADLGIHFSASKMLLMKGNERYPGMLETKQSHSQIVAMHTSCDGKNSRVAIDKNIASCSGDNVLEEKRVASLCNLVDTKFSDIPKGVFDAIRMLRLSRMDILKWMNSNTSLLDLNGFFLRLRLGKWEEGLGGTGYYVACITGEQRENPPQGSKKAISVKVGGIRCLVESQYISNQDFHEDELMAWWCAMMRSGGKIPTEDYLKSKFEERKRFGF